MFDAAEAGRNSQFVGADAARGPIAFVASNPIDGGSGAGSNGEEEQGAPGINRPPACVSRIFALNDVAFAPLRLAGNILRARLRYNNHRRTCELWIWSDEQRGHFGTKANRANVLAR